MQNLTHFCRFVKNLRAVTGSSILARFLLRHDQRADEANVLCRSPVGWDDR